MAHYQIAACGTLATWAKQLGESDNLHVLLEGFDEERRADENLSQYGKHSVNPNAAV